MRPLLHLLPPLALACACFPSSAFETWGSGDAASSGTTGESSSSSGESLTASGGSTEATTSTSDATATSTSTGDATSGEPTTSSTGGADTSTSGDPPCEPAVLAITATRDAFALDGGPILCSNGFGGECRLLNAGITTELAVGGIFYHTDYYADFALAAAIAEAGYGPTDVSSIRLHVWARSDPKDGSAATTWSIRRIGPDQVWLEGTKDRKLAVDGDSSFHHRMIDGDAQILWSGGDGPAGASIEIATMALAGGLYVEPEEFVSDDLLAGLVPWLDDPAGEQGLVLSAKMLSTHVLQARESGMPPTLEVRLCE